MHAGEFQPESAMALLNSLLNITFGEEKWIENITGHQIYLDHKLIKDKQIDLIEIRNLVAEFITQFEAVKVALPAHILEQGGSDNGSLTGLYKTYMINRSGDILYILNEGWIPTYKYDKVNYTDQIHIPAVFYGARIKQALINEPYEATDLAPTISEILQIPVPDKSRGKIITGIQ